MNESKSVANKDLVYPKRFPRRWEERRDLSMVKPDYDKTKFPPLPNMSYSFDVSRARNAANI